MQAGMRLPFSFTVYASLSPTLGSGDNLVRKKCFKVCGKNIRLASLQLQVHLVATGTLIPPRHVRYAHRLHHGSNQRAELLVLH